MGSPNPGNSNLAIKNPGNINPVKFKVMEATRREAKIRVVKIRLVKICESQNPGIQIPGKANYVKPKSRILKEGKPKSGK